MRSSDLIKQIFPEINVGRAGACFGLREMAINAILSGDLKSLAGRGQALNYGILSHVGDKITTGYLEKLLASLEKSDITEVKHEKSKEVKTKNSTEENKSTNPASEALDQFNKLIKECSLTTDKLTADEEELLAPFLILEERKSSVTATDQVISPDELKKQIDLASQIQKVLVKKFRPSSEEYKKFLDEHTYIRQLTDIGIFLTNISLLQAPEVFAKEFPGLFAETEIPTHLAQSSRAWTVPVMLEDKEIGGRSFVTGISCRFSAKTLQACLESLEAELIEYIQEMRSKNKEFTIEIPLAITMNSLKHVVTLGYHPQKKWVLIDQNNPESLVEYIEAKNIGAHILKSVLSATVALTYTGKDMEFVIGFQPITKQFILLSAVNTKHNAKGIQGAEKAIATLLKSKRLLTLQELNQNISISVFTSGQAYPDLSPFLLQWRKLQKIAPEMVKKPDEFDHMPLLHLHCLKNTNTETVDEIIQAGADINELDANGYSALARACGFNNQEVALHLLANYKDKLNLNLGEASPLFFALLKGNLVIASELLKAGASILNSKFLYAGAVRSRKPDVIQFLINSKVPCDHFDLSMAENIAAEDKQNSLGIVFIAAGVNLDRAILALQEESCYPIAERLQQNRFKYYVCSLIKEWKDENIFRALRSMLSKDFNTFFTRAVNQWSYSTNKSLAYGTSITQLDSMITLNPDWQLFWREITTRHKAHSEEIRIMQEKILFAYRNHVLAEDWYSSPVQIKQSEQLFNLRMHPFPTDSVCKWLTYRLKHIPYLCTLSEADKTKLNFLTVPRTEHHLLNLNQQLERYTPEKKSFSFFSSKKLKFSDEISNLHRYLQTMLAPNGAGDIKAGPLPPEEGKAREALNALLNETSVLLTPDNFKAIKEIYLFASTQVCTYSEALNASLLELEKFILPKMKGEKVKEIQKLISRIQSFVHQEIKRSRLD